jgi:hypothetical protein
MLSCCANQSCSRALVLSEGRLFQFQIISISVSADDREKMEYDEVPNRETCNFWLCGSCTATMKLVLTPMGGIQLVSLDDPTSEADQLADESLAQSHREATHQRSFGAHQN